MARASTPRSDPPADAETVLVLADGSAGEHACESLLGAAPAQSRALHVTFGSTPDECLTRWRDVTASPGAIGVVAVGDGARSTAADGVSVDQVSIEPVTEPADLTGVNIALSGFLSRWEGGPIAACVHSLSAMLEHVSVERAFRFLNDATGRLKAADVYAHAHLDRTRHDEATVNALAGLFDAAIAVDGDGSRTVRRRVRLTG